MSLLARLAPHLPYVRRYARALTGDQTTGDHYVRVALEARRQAFPNDTLSRLKQAYLSQGGQRSNAAYGWVRADS